MPSPARTSEKCGKTTKKGTPCRLNLTSDGKCPVHDLTDLSARNANVVASFRRNNPAAFRRQRQRAGRRGFEATGKMKGYAKAHEKVMEWRRKHPSGPEQAVIEILERLNVPFGREYPVNGSWLSLDFVLGDVDHKIAIEVNGHQHKASFGENEPRRHKEKMETLRQQGWTVLVLSIQEQDEWEKLIETFLLPWGER